MEIKRIDGFESFEQVARGRWPQEAFKITNTAEGNPVRAAVTEDLMLVTHYGKAEEERGIGKLLYDRFPELAEAEDIEVETGEASIKAVSITVGQLNKDGSRNTTEKRIYRLWARKEEEGKINAKRIYGLFRALKEMQEEGRCCHMLVPTPDGLGVTATRKMLESIFHDTVNRFTVYGTKPKRTMQEPVPTPRKTNTKDPETITVVAKDASYADLLRRVKTEVGIGSVGASILGIKKSDNGNLVITTKGTPKEVEDLKNTIKGKMKGVQVRYRPKKKGRIIHVRDIDAITEEAEVERAFRDTLLEGDVERDITVVSIRPSYGDTQTATVQVPAEVADRVTKSGRIKIGIVMCGTRLRVDMTSCYRCWEEGHQARDCRGVDRKGHCRRCGAEGHEARGCSDEPFCPLCDRKGHSAGNTGCPIFRRALGKARKKETPGRRGSTASK